MATQSKKRRLDWLNFFYGTGAAVVLTGAMFHFLNWQYSDQLLFAGLTTEAIVFLVSAFEWKSLKNEYHWEKVFPSLIKEGPSKMEQIDQMVEKARLDPHVIERLTRSIEMLEQNVSKMNQISDSAQLTEHISRMKQSSENFESEINKLNRSIAEMNNYYVKMLEVMGNKK